MKPQNHFNIIIINSINKSTSNW